ncbi:SAV_915 family protein [Streptomyces sp. AC627_RSS907]|uniref:SAV_915 family protein n=1 Tax=Streptomyces sp. AC627_RSS907 TaxID=2823684 RepID=UPI0020B775C9|nr:SAV_915 family protein [Streptomyces sp. AC627_RSS907]
MTSNDMPPSAPEHLVLPTMGEVPQLPDGSLMADSTVDVMLVPVAGNSGAEQLVALAFSTVPLLVEAMGEQQPWVIIRTSELEGALRGSGARSVLIDPRLADVTE